MPSIQDYLTKQLYIDKNVVTFRSLSRQFSIHVNTAKNELSNFHGSSANADTRSFATYLISGELNPQQLSNRTVPAQTEDGMEVDMEQDVSSDDEEETPMTTITLVGENDLEHAKSRYARIFSAHIYCLSPSPLIDAGLVREPSAIVHNADTKDAPASSVALGRIVSPDVKIGKPVAPVASSSKAVDPLSRKPTLKTKTAETPPLAKPTENVKEKEKETASVPKPKATGKLDWSKAKKSSDASKSKEAKKEEGNKPNAVAEAKVEKTPPMRIKPEAEKSPQDDSKRGVKRKAVLPPSAETEEKVKDKDKVSPALFSNEAKLRNNRVVSDDEDEERASRPLPKNKGKARASLAASMLNDDDDYASARAMFDVDDSHVEMASSTRGKPKPGAPQPSHDEDVEMASEPEAEQQTQQDEIGDGDIDMEDEDDKPKPKPRKRKEKKVVPVGRNGLKKKRVVKSRMTTDEKGYMVTEDYSEYESVDEEEPEPEKKSKGKKATTGSSSTAKAKRGGSDEETSKPKLKPKPIARTSSIKGKPGGGTKSGGQGNLKDFFGKKK